MCLDLYIQAWGRYLEVKSGQEEVPTSCVLRVILEVLEVNVLIFHCFYNRNGDFGGQSIDFSVLL